MHDTKLTADLLTNLAAASALAWCVIFARLLRAGQLVPYQPRRQVPWTGWDVVAVIWTGICCAIITPAVTFKYFGADVRDVQSPNYLDALITTVVVSGTATLLASVGYLLARGFSFTALGFDSERLLYDAALGIIALLAVDFPLLGIQAVLTHFWPFEHPLIEAVRQHPRIGVVAAIGGVAVLLAPLLEELMFRVVIQGWMEKAIRAARRNNLRLRAVPAGAVPIVVSSLLFALLHAPGPAPVPIFLLGLTLGYLYHQTHRIWPSLVLHMGFNAITVLIMAASLDPGVTPR